ncbi:MAG: 50S ribosomal protein L25/general stress protein Ctc [Oscillibacter ruminantium]|uniref:50S ribosomal protein L25/general stress protein Ctc n=1 Tax=Oscillibacter ruminantium TaxID=1263547 RepID=UPI002B1EB608|nr:50S ribosomal protein L25/general stress protein Ctc [Oscillibacter ruminantium]MEA5042308.1 50S ribosomal protein L25/general stress protein Ctc [Oscillibacter ruminantium]
MNTITVEKRDFSVKAKHLRRNGHIPGSVFGGPLKESISLQIDESTARQLVRHKREGSKLKLELDGKVIPVQIREKSIDNLNNEILHFRFQALAPSQPVSSVIHIILKNMEKVTASLERMVSEIPYTSLPEDMIDTITIDVDGMPVGSVLTVGDIPELNNEKIDLKIDKDEIILRIKDAKRIGASTVEQAAE